MIAASSREELDARLAARGARPSGPRVALVPTMGALHAGHAGLIDAARARADTVVVSIFVNPLQFAAGEDLGRYPRTLEADLELCRRHGVDCVFVPAVDEVYPGGEPLVTVDPGPLGTVLEGASRPGHFIGVLTVVAKLFGLVRPALAVFGEKDYQQLVLVRQLVADLCLPVQVVGCPTAREPDGLARSSRNRYLDPRQREQALALSKALRAGAAAAGGAAEVSRAAETVLREAPGVVVDYVAVRGPDLGEPPTMGAARLLLAARIGSTRLIDNAEVTLA